MGKLLCRQRSLKALRSDHAARVEAVSTWAPQRAQFHEARRKCRFGTKAGLGGEFAGRRAEKLDIPASELLQEVVLSAASGVSRWGQFDPLALVSEPAEAHDLPLELTARKFTTVEVPHSDPSWRWYPGLGFTKKGLRRITAKDRSA